MQAFVGIDLGREPASDEAKCASSGICWKRMTWARGYLRPWASICGSARHEVSMGTIINATIINAQASTKNKDKRHDPERRQTKKGNQWYKGYQGTYRG